MKTSILVSSRKNITFLIETVNSYIDLCSSPKNIEVLIAFDDDDDTRFSAIERFKDNSLVKMFELKRVGYWRLHEVIGFLSSQSVGSILWLATDKCVVKTLHWDKVLEPYENKFLVGASMTDWIEENKPVIRRGGILLPLIHRKWYEVLNKIGNDVHMDSGISFTLSHLTEFGDFGKELSKKIYVNFPNLVVEMDRRKTPNVVDKPGSSDFFSKESHEQRFKDCQKIVEFLKNNPQYIP